MTSVPVTRTHSAAPGLCFEGASVGYGSAAVVHGVSLQVKCGELLGLIGPNGAGKSTLLRAITGGADLLGGTLEIAGAPHHAFDPASRARMVGVVPQSPPALFAFTAREFVAMGRHAHLGRFATGSEADETVVERSMLLTDTLRLAGERVDTLSGGDLQRLTLAQALAQQPHVLLLDEPTSHLDLNHRLQVLDLVRDHAEQGLAVLAVFHDLDLAARYSDRLAVVHGGRVPMIGTPPEVLTPDLLRDVFSVRAVVGADPVTGSVSVTPVLREEATAPHRDETVFLVCGSGSGAALMRRLVLDGYRVTACGLNRGDVDREVALALGIEFVDLPPFGQITPGDRDEIARLAASADVRIVCDVPFGRGNLANLEVLTAFKGPLVLVGSLDDGRDFADGEATRLLESLALRPTSLRVAHVDEVSPMIEGLLGSSEVESPDGAD